MRDHGSPIPWRPRSVTSRSSGVVNGASSWDRGQIAEAVALLDRALHTTSEHVTIDARDLTFIDAHGIGALIAAHARTGVSVRHARPGCRRVFALCALGHLLDDGPRRS